MATALENVLAHARTEGFLGPAPIDDHIANGVAFANVIARHLETEPSSPAKLVDLGSGGGVPALVVATQLEQVSLTLIDRGDRRCTFLDEAVESLGLGDRCDVVLGDAAALGRDPVWHGVADMVTARSYGPPAVAAETAARLLRDAGRLVVSEPPDSDGSRWVVEGLAQLGYGPAAIHTDPATDIAVVPRTQPVPDRYPRRDAAMRKKPLF